MLNVFVLRREGIVGEFESTCDAGGFARECRESAV